MKQYKMLAILGSPFAEGRTAQMLEVAVAAAKQKGWQVDIIKLYEKNIAYCKGCQACVKSGSCVQQDDLHAIAEQLKACDIAVLAAPTYWANVPAVVKNLFDRLFGVVMQETATFPKPLLRAEQKYLLLTACHTPAFFCTIFGQSSGAFHAMREFFKTAGMTSAGQIVWAGKKYGVAMPTSIRNRIVKTLKKSLDI